jgi:two-component system, NtrC family, nitrogen regulation sensor histidine kinase NtrY
MKLSLKITLFLFFMTAVFIAVLAAYFTSEINRNFRDQADRLLKQSVTLTEQRIELSKEQLQAELHSLKESLFTENENTLAAMLSDPPNYNAEVIGFAEKLRRRTTLDFLYLVSSDGKILSNSIEPAAFGKMDLHPDLTVDEIVFVQEGNASMELKKQLRFGKHLLFLRGGYFLKDKIGRLTLSGLQLTYAEGNPSAAASNIQNEPMFLKETIHFKDFYGKPLAILTVSASQEKLLGQKEEILKNSLYLLVASLFFCLLIGWLISLSISRPLHHLTAAAQEMSSGNFDVRVEKRGTGEIGKLIQAFNTMTEQLEINRQKLIQTERIAAWQEIARHLAHEIKNPLTPIKTSITNLRLAMEHAPEQFPEIFRESSESIIEEVESLRHLADEFARFARLPAPQMEINHLNDIVQKAITLYKNSVPSKVTLRWNAGEVPAFKFDSGQITQVTQNLLQNSMEALADGGEILVTTAMSDQLEKKWATLSVQDSGSGMNEQIKQHVFTPYFTTKQKGMGLGLAIVHRIVTEHGGNILVESEPGKGTKFEVRLPLS